MSMIAGSRSDLTSDEVAEAFRDSLESNHVVVPEAAFDVNPRNGQPVHARNTIVGAGRSNRLLCAQVTLSHEPGLTLLHVARSRLGAADSPGINGLVARLWVGFQVRMALKAAFGPPRPRPPGRDEYEASDRIEGATYEGRAGRRSARRSSQLQRAGGFWKDRLRGYAVKVDGQKVARLREYDTVVLDVDPGEHRVKVKIDFLGSRNLDIDCRPGETTSLVCAAGSVNGFQQVGGYIKLWKGSLTFGTVERGIFPNRSRSGDV